jgi:dTDP-4-dehydrorhamnose reductase
MNKIYVLGGNGYIGSSLFEYLNDNGLDAYACVRSYKAKLLLGSKSNYSGKVEVINYNKISENLNEECIVINCSFGLNNSYKESRLYYRNLIKSLSHNKKIKRFIHLSTIAVYSKSKTFGFLNNFYVSEKLFHEQQIKKYFRGNFVILRIGHTYGPDSNHTIYLNDINKKIDIEKFKNTDLIHNFLCINLLKKTIFNILKKLVNLSGVYNLVDYPQKSFYQLLREHRIEKEEVKSFQYFNYSVEKKKTFSLIFTLHETFSGIFIFLPAKIEKALRKIKNLKRFKNIISNYNSRNTLYLPKDYTDIKKVDISDVLKI